MGDYSYSADDLGRTVAVSGPQGTTEYHYEDETGRLLEQTLYDNSEPENKIAYTVYEYDNNGRLSRLAHDKPATPTDELIAEYTNFTYDLAQRRTGFTANLPALLPQYSGTHAFTYNAKGELIGEAFTPTDTQYPATTRAHGYSAAGNITNFKGTQRGYNGANQLTQEWVNGQWVTVADYDGRGNPIEYRDHELEFNQGNHLTAFDETLTAGYTSDGRRIWKEVNGQRTFFVYNGERVIGEMDASGNPTAVNTIGNTGLISREQGGNGPAIYYLFDPLGNVLHRLNNQGTVISSDIYDAWGKLEYTNDTSGDPYGYKGQYGYYTDHETGLILCTHRYYDPETGRWLTKDPIGHEGGVNLYGYCGNDAVDMVDPSGYDNVLIVLGNNKTTYGGIDMTRLQEFQYKLWIKCCKLRGKTNKYVILKGDKCTSTNINSELFKADAFIFSGHGMNGALELADGDMIDSLFFVGYNDDGPLAKRKLKWAYINSCYSNVAHLKEALVGNGRIEEKNFRAKDGFSISPLHLSLPKFHYGDRRPKRNTRRNYGDSGDMQAMGELFDMIINGEVGWWGRTDYENSIFK